MSRSLDDYLDMADDAKKLSREEPTPVTVAAFNTAMNGGNDPRVATRLHPENPIVLEQIPGICIEMCEGVRSAKPDHPELRNDVKRALFALAKSPLLRRIVIAAEGELTLRELQRASAARSDRWHQHEQGAAWSLLEWAGAMCGEAGEAANVAKKIKRTDTGLIGNEQAENAITDRAALVKKLAGEIAGTILYAERLATAAGLDLETVLVETFNAKSIALGFPDRLGVNNG